MPLHQPCFSGSKKSCLPHLWGHPRVASLALRAIHLQVARWIWAKPGAAGSEGVPTFQRKVGISEYLLRKYSDSPRPSGTPLINAGGKI